MISDRLIEKLRHEFLEATDDDLDAIEEIANLRLKNELEPKQALEEIVRKIHSIKGTSASVGFPIISTIAHRLEDFLDGITDLNEAIISGLGKYCDKMREIVAEGKEPPHANTAQLLRALPLRHTSHDFEVDVLDVEVLLVTPSKMIAKIVRNELMQCGFRVARASGAMEAFQLAVRSQPDAMIFAQTLDELSGADLARAFKAMTETAARPIGILTSFPIDHPALQGLPDDVVIIRTGRVHFSDDMGDFLAYIQSEFL
ncbi:MAG: Hpt domain-containing protein [Kordiimonadaceae bacterium]|nr:Hpt domain-containing protein [Kordiimonadaceae bacterium]